MDRFSKQLERWYERTQITVDALLEHWSTHANRRTVAIILVVGVAAVLIYLFAIRPPDTFPTGTLISVDQGEGVAQIAADLKEQGVIRSAILFRVVVTLLGEDRDLHAGDYLFKQPEDVFTVAHAVAIGQYGLEPLRIRVPEGATTRQMADIFSSQLQRFNPQTFLAKAQPMEGYLFPDTYFFLPNATAETVIAAMRQNFDTHEATIDADVQASGHALSDIVIMASILEREARTMQDRQLIAGVLWRRIQLGMLLQADATFLYTIPPGSPITVEVLHTDTPYNTYIHKGLPPTAIGSPSLSSLEAAATPIDKGYLFYLADAQGITHYCKTYTCQVANERRYLGK
jgi:UPF0755 protein